MTNYRRLISYIYAYEGDVKGKNIGFAKLESRNGQCKLSVNVKKVYVGSSDLGVYLLAPGKEIFLGSIFIRGGSGEFRAAVAVDNAADSGCSMDQCYGLTIHEKGESWRAYTTIWEDAVAQAAELELASVTSENRGNADEQIHKKITELDREIKAQENAGALLPEEADIDLELIDIQVDQEENKPRSERYEEESSQMGISDIEHLSQNGAEGPANIEGRKGGGQEDTIEDEALEDDCKQSAIRKERSDEFICSSSDKEGLGADSHGVELTHSQSQEERAVESQWNEPADQEIQTVQEEALKERTGSGMASGGISMNDAAAALVAALASNRTVGSGVVSAQSPGTPTATILPHYANPSPVPTPKTAPEDSYSRPVYTGKSQVTPGQAGDGVMKIPEGQRGSVMIPMSGNQGGTGTIPMSGNQEGTGTIPISGNQEGTGTIPMSGNQEGTGTIPTPGGQGETKTTPMSGAQGEIGTIPMPEGHGGTGTVSIPGGAASSGTGASHVRPAASGASYRHAGSVSAGIAPTSDRQATYGMGSMSGGSMSSRMSFSPGRAVSSGMTSRPARGENSGITAPSANVSSPGAAQSAGREPVPGSHDPELSQPTDREQSPVVDAGEETLPLGDPQELARLEEEEQEYYQPQQLWESFRKRYPKIQAFDSANGCEILTIKPQDIGLLPRENWNYGNNSFLLHGYYNYRYLVLARIGGDSGTRIRYILGVPGHYYSNEKYMASMFGFPHFVLSKKQPSQDGRFGYWYTDIRLQNQD